MKCPFSVTHSTVSEFRPNDKCPDHLHQQYEERCTNQYLPYSLLCWLSTSNVASTFLKSSSVSTLCKIRKRKQGRRGVFAASAGDVSSSGEAFLFSSQLSREEEVTLMVATLLADGFDFSQDQSINRCLFVPSLFDSDDSCRRTEWQDKRKPNF